MNSDNQKLWDRIIEIYKEQNDIRTRLKTKKIASSFFQNFARMLGGGAGQQLNNHDLKDVYEEEIESIHQGLRDRREALNKELEAITKELNRRSDEES